MRFTIDRISPTDITELSAEEFEKLSGSLFWEPEVGQKFIIEGDMEIHTIEHVLDVSEENDIIYDNGTGINFAKCFPILSVSNLIDLITTECHAEISSHSSGWVVNYDSIEMFKTKDRDGLCNLLWQVFKFQALGKVQSDQLR